uniref:Uncharacterized protein n=1 Tax=Arundo donax TaxID=35708 RepID=A0A0A8ZL79_ARUDO
MIKQSLLGNNSKLYEQASSQLKEQLRCDSENKRYSYL